MAAQSHRPRRSRTAQLLSTILFILAIGFAAAAAWIWYTDDSSGGPGTPPAADNAGEIELAHVLGALKEIDGDWDYGRSPATARTDQLDVPGQHLKNGDQQLFVFIFTGPDGASRIAAREAASEQIDLDTMTLSSPSGQVINDDGEQLYMAEHSSVITILVGGDQELADEVAEALSTLP